MVNITVRYWHGRKNRTMGRQTWQPQRLGKIVVYKLREDVEALVVLQQDDLGLGLVSRSSILDVAVSDPVVDGMVGGRG
jgi:hypothetical protein